MQFAATVALLFVAFTMLLRANDLIRSKDQHGRWYWRIRALGLVIAGVAPWAIIGGIWVRGQHVTPAMAAFSVGIMLVFLTTPNLPPWWQYWFKGDARPTRRNSIDRTRDEHP